MRRIPPDARLPACDPADRTAHGGRSIRIVATTLDLPDDLVRRIQIEAAKSDRTLKDHVAQRLEAGLRASRDGGRERSSSTPTSSPVG